MDRVLFLRGELGVCEEFLEVGGEEAIAVEDVEGEEAEAVGGCDGFVVEAADYLVGEAFGLFVVFVQTCGEDLGGIMNQLHKSSGSVKSEVWLTCSTEATSGNLNFWNRFMLSCAILKCSAYASFIS